MLSAKEERVMNDFKPCLDTPDTAVFWKLK